jgi:predicted Zn finger-like uncharacterized protein
MTSHWITECPHCGTSFRVTEQHLRAAKGSVRCGSCLQIFNAINTLFPSEEASETPDVATPTHSPITPPPDTPEPTPFAQDIPITTTIDATPTQSLVYRSSIIEAFASGEVAYDQPSPRQQWENDQVQYADKPLIDAPESSSTHQEHWHDDNDYATKLDTPNITTPELDTPVIDTPHLDETFLEATANAQWDYEDDIDYLVPDTSAGETVDDEKLETTIDAAPSLYDDSEPDFGPYLAPEPEPILEREHDAPPTTPRTLHADDILLGGESRIPNHDELQSENVLQSNRDEDEQDWQTIHEEQEPHIGPYREPFRDALLSELEAEPPRGFQWHEASTPLHSKLLWWSLSTLLVMALGIQYVMFHYGDFASALQKPPFDGWMRSVCETVSCHFIKTDLSLVTNEDLIIRTHPTQNGFLVLDTLLYNRAPFEQPFPLLDLGFSDMKNKVIARRVFTPAEYLTGDLANLATMPINTPLHISFAIKNPSELATNYELNLITNSR